MPSLALKQVLASPKRQSLAGMTLASAVHCAGYELARNSVIALFTSEKTGFSSSAAMPAATGFISPLSLGLLWMYTWILERHGPRVALRRSTVLCTVIFASASILMGIVEPKVNESVLLRNFSKWFLFALFVIQNGFVQLLFTQHWSFLGSLGSDQKDGSAWFAPVAGFGSAASTLAAFAVKPLSIALTLPGLLFVSSLLILMSAFCADFAYDVAEKNNFEPHAERKQEKQNPSVETKQSMITKTKNLFDRVPILKALCSEVLICQCLSSLVSFLFLWQVKETITNDQERAGWTGRCYALINGTSFFLQFFVIPWLVQHIDPRRLWTLMPVAMLGFAGFMSVNKQVNLFVVAGSFCTMKTLEYSLRGVSNEMVYASLDYESRFVGKEVIGLFANRLGKSSMAVVLSILTASVPSSYLHGILPW
eukprot:CAMPEP_0202444332 /NCGR_PEP_ID=MMETSP1360-20130828/3453_1 /ASSEMBLY_ACC=CAM_ASM_000848 /TAXON_ID=515479 /ORGANISM="Licmophora paradoxa, Strain CCMP2313" /LENGTH=422 /DNA_ID=CAMNT_0049060305 /DNA_START=72 /DNA_END=1337 /DNA_ORIENTATION=-